MPLLMVERLLSWNFIEKELVPHVEANYPVTQFRTLIGHSYGGLFTLFALAERPALFNYYLAIDPSMNWSGGITITSFQKN